MATTELIVTSILQSNSIGAISLTQAHTLRIFGILEQSSLDDLSLDYPSHIITLSVSNIAALNYIDSITLTLGNYFPWGSVGYANTLEINELATTVRHQYPGYTATRARNTRMQKKFLLGWVAMSSDQWLSLVTFWRNHYGAADAFYFEFPLALYGAGSFGGVDGAEPFDGFDAELSFGYGDGPTFLVRFESDELPQRYLTEYPGYWQANIELIEVA